MAIMFGLAHARVRSRQWQLVAPASRMMSARITNTKAPPGGAPGGAGGEGRVGGKPSRVRADHEPRMMWSIRRGATEQLSFTALQL